MDVICVSTGNGQITTTTTKIGRTGRNQSSSATNERGTNERTNDSQPRSGGDDRTSSESHKHTLGLPSTEPAWRSPSEASRIAAHRPRCSKRVIPASRRAALWKRTSWARRSCPTTTRSNPRRPRPPSRASPRRGPAPSSDSPNCAGTEQPSVDLRTITYLNGVRVPFESRRGRGRRPRQREARNFSTGGQRADGAEGLVRGQLGDGGHQTPAKRTGRHRPHPT